MKNLIKSLAIVLLVGVSCVTAIRSQDKKVIYQDVKVTTFEIKPETEFSESMRDVMMSEIVDELMKTKKFSSVQNVSAKESVETSTIDNSAKTKSQIETIPGDSVLRLTGIVTEFKKGNRTARYLIGFGAGRAKVKAHIKVVDSAGKVLLEKDVDGNVVIGLFGGDTNGITRGLAKEIAKDIVKKILK